ncbi:MAG: TCR/Tet family MFS transporter [Gallionellaceae bacterium]|jgi:DHA1 family tetracycline resistance protein-like MFS transporter|nr:TCR/Tet family MFS transporter [Gallionellaceae bacterium]
MNKSLIVIFATICLDAIGIGLIFPILPRLLEEVTHTSDVSHYIGLIVAPYAAMQFIFAPALGALSDRWGRRPVLLISLAGAVINYLVMAFTPYFWLLLIGRIVAGLTSANMSVATAYITDITPPEQRARRFGLFNAVFGSGFIIGPVLGGVLGDYWVRLPFIIAAALNAANLLLAWFALPESRAASSREKIDLAALNPLRPLRWVASMTSLIPVILLFVLLTVNGEAYGTCWALWGQDSFAWNGLWVGLSLGAFGTCQSLAQAFLPGPAVKRFGERGAILIGIAATCIALVVMAFAQQGWMIFAIMPIFALGGIGIPALQSFATRLVDENRQGQLQGVLASAISLASIVAPLGFTGIYSVIRASWPGAIWLLVVAIYAVAAVMVAGLRFRANEAEPIRHSAP